MPPGTRVTGHGHDAPHLCLVMEGELRQRANGCHHRLVPGGLRLSPPGAEHEIRVGDTGARVLIAHAVGPGEPAQVARLFQTEEFRSLANLHSVATRLGSILETPSPPPLRAEEAVDELLAVTRRSGRKLPEAAPAWLLEVRARITAELPGSIPVASLARSAGVHRVHLSRAFAEYFGCSVSVFTRRRRLDQAWRLLADPDLDLAWISAQSGFSDQSHFTRVFSRAMGASPGQWRKAVTDHLATPWLSW